MLIPSLHLTRKTTVGLLYPHSDLIHKRSFPVLHVTHWADPERGRGIPVVGPPPPFSGTYNLKLKKQQL